MENFEEQIRREEQEEKQKEEDWKWSRLNTGDKNCEHEMEYSQTLGVVGGICKKCGYKTY